MPPIALTIAGSDPSGGAGIQADLKTFHQFGVYGEAVITLLTVQNTVRVSRVEVMPPALVLEQLAAVLEDIPPTAAKTGALGSAAMVEALARAAAAFTFPLVVDPVMVSKHGLSLLPADAVDAIRALLVPRAFLITPNVPEAEALTGIKILTLDDMRRAACRLRELGARAVLIKGGHMEGDATDLLFDGAALARIPGAARRHAAHPRYRLHLLRRHYRRTGPRTSPGRSRGVRQTFYSRSHPHQSGPRPRIRSGQPPGEGRMKFQQLLANAIESSEIPLRFEPGATEAVAKPITGMLQAWISAHIPPDTGSEFDAGCAALAAQLLAELSDAADLPE